MEARIPELNAAELVTLALAFTGRRDGAPEVCGFIGKEKNSLANMQFHFDEPDG